MNSITIKLKGIQVYVLIDLLSQANYKRAMYLFIIAIFLTDNI